MLEELIPLEDSFQPYLLNGDYTFIGPSDTALLEPFMKQANAFAPVVAITRKLRHFLGNKNATRRALEVLPAGTPLRIYVITQTSGDNLFHNTIEGYCDRNHINFPPREGD